MDMHNQIIRQLMHNRKYAAITEFAKINNDDRNESIIVSEYLGDEPRLMIRDNEIHILCPKEMTVVQEDGIADSIANGTIFDDASLLNDQADYMRRTILPMNAIANKHGIEPKKIRVLITGVMGRINDDGNIEISFGDVENGKNFLDDITSGRGCEHVNKMCDHYLGLKNDTDRMEGHCSLPLDIRRDIHELTKEIDSITDVSPEDEVTEDDFDPFDKKYDMEKIESDPETIDESDKSDTEDEFESEEPDVDEDDAEVDSGDDDNMKEKEEDDNESESDEKEEDEDESSEEDSKESTEEDEDEESVTNDEDEESEFEEDEDDDSALDNESEEKDKKKTKKKSEKKSIKDKKKVEKKAEKKAERDAEEIENSEDMDDEDDESYVGESFLSRHPKRLKPIERSIISYITVELNAIKDSNDQAMLAGYCSAKLELVDFYLNCIDTQDPRYLVPHNKQYLTQMQTELNDLLKRILQIKPINKYDRIWGGIF